MLSPLRIAVALRRTRWAARRLAALAAVLLATAAAPAIAAAPPLVLRVTLLGPATDARVPHVHAALAHWNGELARGGVRVRFVLHRAVSGPLPEPALAAASGARQRGGWPVPADGRLRAVLAAVPGDVVIALSQADLISFAVPWHGGARGIVGLRPATQWPLVLPNVAPNVVAHELGHVLGLGHTGDAHTLMCGRPAPCRPAAFASDTVRFFPLTTREVHTLRRRWGTRAPPAERPGTGASGT